MEKTNQLRSYSSIKTASEFYKTQSEAGIEEQCGFLHYIFRELISYSRK